MRLKDKVAIVVGAGQSPGEGIGNGRATALTFGREGAKVLCVDNRLESAQETADMMATKAAMVSFTEQLAYQNAQYGIRANVILPGLMNTPMAVDTRAREFKKSRAEVEAQRDAQVPLRQKMGTGWDVANAALFLASDEANFITGVTLPVDGGASVRRG